MGLKPAARRASRDVEGHVEFLNVDLELQGPSEFGPLIEALGQSDLDVLYQTESAPFFAILEISRVGLDCAETISALLDLVEALGDEGRRRWQECTTRRFDVGISAGLDPASSRFPIEASLS